MNRSELIGRIVKDVDLTTTNNGTSVAKFTLAVDRKFKNDTGEKVADFINIVAWKTLGENIAKYCKKGSKVFVAGELQTRTYDDKEGIKRYITEIIAHECEFLDTKCSTEKQNESQSNADLKPVDDDNLPF